MRFTLGLLASAVVLLCCTEASQQKTPPDGHRFTFSDSSYVLSSVQADWYNAKKICNLYYDMELVSINSEDEQNALVAQYGIYGESFWTSGSDPDVAIEHAFYWESSGHAFGPYLNWGESQPDTNATNSLFQCVLMDHLDGYKWNDVGCAWPSLRFICETKGNTPTGGFVFNDKIYEISPIRFDWWTAKYECRSRGMELVSIESSDENEAVRLGVQAYDQTEEFWISATNLGRGESFYWDSTGEFLGPFTDWEEGEPNDVTGSEHCVHLQVNLNASSHHWNNNDCSKHFRYICEGDYNDKNKKANNVLKINNVEKLFRSGRNLYTISSVKMDWYFAKIDCKLKGMELLSVESAEEQAMVENGLSEYNEPFWLSGTDEGHSSYFTWDSTGRSFGRYTNWGALEPDNGANDNVTEQNCVMMNNEDGNRWYDFGCKDKEFRFVCEQKSTFDDETTQFTFGDSFYEVPALSLEWYIAARECSSRGMELASIESQEEHDAILLGLASFDTTPTRFWISGTDTGDVMKHYWYSTGRLINATYSNWGPGEPNYEPAEHCVMMLQNSGHTWATKPCHWKHRYICELKISA